MAIIDMHMPDMDGAELAAALRQSTHGSRLPMLLLSSAAFRPGANVEPYFAAVLMKPVRSAVMRRELRTVLNGNGSNPDGFGGRAAVMDAPATLRILMAEDNLTNQRVTQLLLGKLGREADIACDGAGAIAAAMQRTYDVILMDMRMPGIDGLEATRRIRADSGTRPQPYIVAMTANAMTEDRAACRDAGMDDFIAKPVRAREIERALHRALQRRASLEPTVASRTAAFGDDESGSTRELADSREESIRRRLAELTDIDDAQNDVLVAGLIVSFAERADAELSAVSAAISAQDAHRLASLAHSLKGSAANVGADRFATHCSALEEAARSRVWSEVDGELAAARDEWRRVEPCLRAVAGALAGTRAGTILEEQPRESSDW